jgi:hypothetical protein
MRNINAFLFISILTYYCKHDRNDSIKFMSNLNCSDTAVVALKGESKTQTVIYYQNNATLYGALVDRGMKMSYSAIETELLRLTTQKQIKLNSADSLLFHKAQISNDFMTKSISEYCDTSGWVHQNIVSQDTIAAIAYLAIEEGGCLLYGDLTGGYKFVSNKFIRKKISEQCNSLQLSR